MKKTMCKLFKGFSSKKLFITVIVVMVMIGMAGFGVTQYSKSTKNSNALTVGKVSIPTNIFTAEYAMTLQQNAAIIQRSPYAAQFILQNMVSQNVSSLLLINEAMDLNIGASKDLIYKSIGRVKFFQNESGNFDKQKFEMAIKNSYGSEKTYVNIIRNDLMKIQLLQNLQGSVYISSKMYKYFDSYFKQTRNIRYVSFSPKMVKVTAKPSNKDLLKILNANKANYTSPEYRSMEVLSVNVLNYAADQPVTNKDVKTYYGKHKSQYIKPQSVDISQILLDSKKEANIVYKKLKNKHSLKGVGKKVTYLKNVTINDLPIALKNSITKHMVLNLVQEPVKTSLGYHVLIITKKYPRTYLSFSNSKKQIKQMLTGERLSKIYVQLKSKLASKSKSISNIKTLAKSFKGSKYYKFSNVNKSGFDKKRNVVAFLANHPDILSSAFNTAKGSTSDVISNNANLYLVKINSIKPKHLESLSASKPMLVKAWKSSQVMIKLRKKASKLISYFQNHKKLSGSGFKVQKIILSKKSVIMSQQSSKYRSSKLSPFDKFSYDTILLAHANSPIEGSLNNGNLFVGVVKKITNHYSNRKKSQFDKQVYGLLTKNYTQNMIANLLQNLQKKFKVSLNKEAISKALSDNRMLSKAIKP